MRLTILGCRAGMPADGQASSGYLVETAAATLLLDCGPGVATVLSGLVPAVRPDAVVITHMHLDHCYDLLPLGKTLLAEVLGQASPGAAPVVDADLDPVPLLVPRGAGDVLTRLAALFPVSTAPVLDRAFELAFAVQEYDPGLRLRLGTAPAEVDVHLIPLRHAAPSCGARVSTSEGTLAYTGDTGPTQALMTLARDADLLLAEASLEQPDPGPHGHLCAADAGFVAQEARVGQLVLTHLPTAEPDQLQVCAAQAAEHFAGPVHIAQPLSVLTVGELSPVVR